MGKRIKLVDETKKNRFPTVTFHSEESFERFKKAVRLLGRNENPKTYADWIRSLDDEELAEYLHIRDLNTAAYGVMTEWDILEYLRQRFNQEEDDEA